MSKDRKKPKKFDVNKVLIFLAVVCSIFAITLIALTYLNKVQILANSVTEIKESYSGTTLETNIWDISATENDRVTATLDQNGVLTISGTGNMVEWYSGSSVPWYSVREQIKNMKIEEGVTNIASMAWCGCINLMKIKISSSVTDMSTSWLDDCESLISIEVDVNNGKYCDDNGVLYSKDKTNIMQYPAGKTETVYSILSGVTTISQFAFRGNTSLTRIEIPSSVAGMGENSFLNCTKLTNIEVDENNGKYCDDNGVLYSKDKTKIIKYPEGKIETLYSILNGVTSIGNYAFYNSNGLYNIIIPEGVTSIGNYAFDSCGNLINIEIPSSITRIGESSFNGAKITKYITVGINEVELPSILKRAQDETDILYSNSILYTNCAIEDNKIKIDNGAPYGKVVIYTGELIGLTYQITYNTWDISATEEDSVTATLDENGILTISGTGNMKEWEDNRSVSWYSIMEKIKNIKIEDGITNIGTYAFFPCSGLTNIEIPSSVTSIGDYAFRGCSSLINIEIPKGVTEIGDYAFSNCVNLTSIKVPQGVTTISNNTFENCSSLTSVEIPTSVTYIGSAAFKACSSLVNIQIPSSVTGIGADSFRVCTKLTNIEVDENNGKYCDDNGVLYSKDKTKIIKYPEGKTETNYIILDGVTVIGNGAFAYCENLKSIKIPDGVTVIGDGAFAYCENLKSIKIPDGVTKIGTDAFSYCKSIIEMRIPSSVENIEGGTYIDDDGVFVGIICSGQFTGCTSLTSIEVDENNKKYCDENGILYTKDKVILLAYPSGKIGTQTKISNNTQCIGYRAFNNCDNLTNIEIPQSVRAIHQEAFSGCTNLTRVTIPSSVTGIGVLAFRGCSKLTIYCRSNSTAEQYSIKYDIPYIIDDENPIIEGVIGNPTEWTNENIILTINGAEDSTVGLAEKPYSFDGGETWQAENTKTYKENTEGIIIKVRDAVGNTYTHETINITKIDKELPIIESVTGNPTEWINENVTLTINAKDELSGLAEKPYSFDGGETWQSESTKTYEENTEGIIIKVRDILGNTYTHETINITKIDKVVPTIESIEGNPIEWTEENVILTVNAEDNLSGLAEMPYSFDGGETWQAENTKAYEENTEGIVIKVRDQAGNVTTYEEIVNITKIRKVTGIEVTSMPKTQYKAYENFDTTGMIVKVIYDTGNKEETTNYTVVNGTNLTCKVEKIEVQYNKNTEIKTEITVSVEHLEVIDAKVEPTCTEKGKTEGKHCSVCNTIIVAQEEIPALGHNHEAKVTEATCLEKGYTTHTCTRCADNYVDTYTDPLGHSFTNYVSNNDATCTEDGTKTAKCDRCHVTDTVVDINSKKPHTEVIDARVEAICTKTGLTEGKHCSVCNTVTVAQKEIPAIGHNHEAKITDPTCEEKGYTTHTCSRCQDSYVDTYTDPLGHSFTNYVSNNDATCTKDGTKTAKCDRCEKTDTKEIPASKTPHTYKDGICEKCGKEEPKITITTEKYKIKDTYITKIQIKTTVKQLKEDIETNATEIKVYDKDNKIQEETATLATGMTIELKYNNKIYTYTIVVSGDVNGDGKIKLADMSLVNRHRLSKKNLEGAYLLAADVNEDGKADFKDLVKINRFRLNKITIL